MAVTHHSSASIHGRLQAVVLQSARGLASLSFCFFLLADVTAQVPTPPLPPASPEMVARLRLLETELRCLVCQNQTLAESPANLAGDLRREIRLLAGAGKSNEEIKQFLQSRYGDFVLYRPPVGPRTYLLWAGPFALLFLGGLVLVWQVRRRARVTPTPVPVTTSADAARAERLLRE
jgi:cytochrome c-type biogenesis protein CcmH